MLSDKTVVVTGSSGALGRAVVRKALNSGAHVIALDLQSAPESAHMDAERHVFRKVNLLDVGALSSVLRDRTVDALFNIAGGFTMGSLSYEASNEEFSRMHDINVGTALNAIRAVMPGMTARARGAVVNVGAYAALSAPAGMSSYCLAKSAVMRLTESLSQEVRGHNVNVNAVLPSIIDTPANRSAMPDEDFSRWVAADDMASVICFLGSDLARAIHGALIPVVGRT